MTGFVVQGHICGLEPVNVSYSQDFRDQTTITTTPQNQISHGLQGGRDVCCGMTEKDKKKKVNG